MTLQAFTHADQNDLSTVDLFAKATALKRREALNRVKPEYLALGDYLGALAK